MSAYLDGNEWIQGPDRELKGLEEAVLVGEHTELASRDTQANAGMNVLSRRLEPSVPLGLFILVRVSPNLREYILRTCRKI